MIKRWIGRGLLASVLLGTGLLCPAAAQVSSPTLLTLQDETIAQGYIATLNCAGVNIVCSGSGLIGTVTVGPVALGSGVSGTLPVGNGGTGTAITFTPGSVIFAGASGVYTEDNANFFWDAAHARLGLGTNAPTRLFHIQGTAAVNAIAQFDAINSARSTLLILNNTVDANFAQLDVRGSTATGTQFGLARAGWSALLFSPTVASTAAIGTISNAPLIIGTNDVERVRILSTGEVGIGTTGPGQMLDVRGNAIFYSGSNNVISKDSGTGYSVFTGQSQNGGGGIVDFGVEGSVAGGNVSGTAANEGFVSTRTNHKLHFGTNATSRVTIDTAGNMGVGTTAPTQSRLVISNGNSTRTQVTVTDGDTASAMIRAGNSLAGIFASDVDLKLRAGANSTNADIGGFTGLTVLAANGNVGIGASTPATKLHIITSAVSTIGAVASSGLHIGDPGALNGISQLSLGWTNGAVNTNAPSAIGFVVTDSGANTKGSLFFATRDVTTDSVPSTRVTIDSAGKVGIGQISPGALLEVNGSFGTKGQLLVNGSTNHSYLTLNSDAIVEAGVNLESAGSRKWSIYRPSSSTDLRFFDATGDRVTIQQTTGNVGLGQTVPTALLHIKAGTTVAGTAPFKLTSGSLLTTPEAGTVEFLTDKFYGGITTGPARTEFTLNDAALTSGRIPFVTTNGRLKDSAFLNWIDASWRLDIRSNTSGDNPSIYLYPGTGSTTPFTITTNNGNNSLDLSRSSWDLSLKVAGTTDGSNYVGFRSTVNMEFRGENTGTTLFTPANGGGEGIVIFGKRLSDSSATVGAHIEFWPRTAQTSTVFSAMAPGGASTEWSVLKSGLAIYGGNESLKPSTGTNAAIFSDGTAPATLASNTAGIYGDDVSGTVNPFGIREDGVNGALVMQSAPLTSGTLPIATTNGLLTDSTTALLLTAGIPKIVASTFEKAGTGTDANVLTYTSGGADEFLVVQVATDISALTGTSLAVTVTWKDSNNATATSTITLGGVTDGSINVPINAKASTSVVVSTTFVGVSTAYNISAYITRLK